MNLTKKGNFFLTFNAKTPANRILYKKKVSNSVHPLPRNEGGVASKDEPSSSVQGWMVKIRGIERPMMEARLLKNGALYRRKNMFQNRY